MDVDSALALVVPPRRNGASWRASARARTRLSASGRPMVTRSSSPVSLMLTRSMASWVRVSRSVVSAPSQARLPSTSMTTTLR